ncbi:MAG: hypothetical protein ACJ72R_06000 [Nitrososphaeraceae archaeon]
MVSQSRKNFEDEFKMITDFAKEHGMAIVPDVFYRICYFFIIVGVDIRHETFT